MNGEPSTIALTTEDDRLPLVRGDLFASAQCASRNPVRENGDVARELYELVTRVAVEDSKAILFPAPELGLVHRTGAEHAGRGVEDECRIGGEAGEVVLATMGAKRLDQTLSGGQDAGDVC